MNMILNLDLIFINEYDTETPKNKKWRNRLTCLSKIIPVISLIRLTHYTSFS